MKITDISVCALKSNDIMKCTQPWYWEIGLNVEDHRAFYIESRNVDKYYPTKKEAISGADEFIKANFKKVKVYYPK